MKNNSLTTGAKSNRFRVEIWASVTPTIEQQIQATGLTATEIINISLIEFFGLSPKRATAHNPQINVVSFPQEDIPAAVTYDDDDDLGL